MLWYRWPPCLPAGLGAYRYALYGQIPYHASSTTGSLYAGRVPCIRPDTLPSRRWLSTVKGENGNQVEDSISITLYLTNSYGFSLDSFYPVTLMKQNGDHTCYDRHQDDVSEKNFMLQRNLPTMLSYILHL